MSTSALVTSEQYLALPDEFDQSGNRIQDELIGGEIVKMPPGSQLHHLVKARIVRLVSAYLDATPASSVTILTEMPFVVSPNDMMIPDASALRKERLTPYRDQYLRGAPDLAIEVVSPTDTANRLKHKVDAYLQNGSKTVWVVYPDSRSVVIHSGDSTREVKGNQRIEDTLLPGFSVPVSSFFELT
jgi:Uma2 family endonuclease